MSRPRQSPSLVGNLGNLVDVATERSEFADAAPSALVGGVTATALDTNDASIHDRNLIIPISLVVILLILMLLLRSILAPVLLIITTVISFGTAGSAPGNWKMPLKTSATGSASTTWSAALRALPCRWRVPVWAMLPGWSEGFCDMRRADCDFTAVDRAGCAEALRADPEAGAIRPHG